MHRRQLTPAGAKQKLVCFDHDGMEDCYRVQQSTCRHTVTADAQTLSNDYSPPWYRVGAKDAQGKIIVEGEKFEFLDVRNKHSADEWIVYKWTKGKRPIPDDPRQRTIEYTDRFLEVSCHATEAEATQALFEHDGHDTAASDRADSNADANAAAGSN